MTEDNIERNEMAARMMARSGSYEDSGHIPHFDRVLDEYDRMYLELGGEG
mgnify:CR=1 FL=1